MELLLHSGNGAQDAAGIAASISWSGDIAQCSRTLSFSLATSPIDANVPVADVPLGARVSLRDGGRDIFDGYVFTRQKLTESSLMEVSCYDRGIYVKRCRASKKYAGATPEGITSQLCAEFGIKPGNIAKTGVKVARNFIGASLYQIIQTAYTLASRSDGEAYQIRFRGDELDVVAKSVSPETLVIRGGSNLMSAAVTESIERLVSQVAIYGDNDELVATVRDDERIKLYGLLQEYVKRGKDKDANAEARKLLDDNGVSQKITVNCLGGIECVTGNAVVVQEPYTGLYGLFWIDSDAHTWKNGLYLNKLTLNFRRMMDEQEAGSLPDVKAKKGAQDMWEYIYGGDGNGG